MAVTHECDAERQRLATLRREITEAEATLFALQTSIQDAKAEAASWSTGTAASEIERLTAENLSANEETASAYAALEEAVRTSRTDALTGLLNRLALFDILEHDVELALRNGMTLAVFFLDVDDFKKVNDAFGHAIGDRLLQGIAGTLMLTMRASDTVCRIGGDEFVVVAPTASRDDAAQLARKLKDALHKSFVLEGLEVASSTSVGFSVFPEDGIAAEELVRNADAAMYQHKGKRQAVD